MKKSNKTQYAILGMLSIEPMSGYEIRQTMKQSTANFWSESDGQLYPALASLSKLKLITSKEMKKNNPREKKEYQLTAAGKTALKTWLQQEAETHNVRNEFLLKLFFGANLPAATNLEQVQAYYYRAKSRLEKIKITKQQVQREDKDSPHFPYWMMSIDYGIQLIQAQLTWCENVINQLKKMKTP